MADKKASLGAVIWVALITYVVFLGVFIYLAYSMLKESYSGSSLWLRLVAILVVFVVATASELVLKIKMGYNRSLPYRLAMVTVFVLVLFWVMDYSLVSAVISTVFIVTLYYFWDRAKARRIEG